jgi:hypothetical protein
VPWSSTRSMSRGYAQFYSIDFNRRASAQKTPLTLLWCSLGASSPMRSLTHSVSITGNGRLDQFGPKLGLLTEFGGGEWFALDLVHHTVLGLFESANNSQQSPNFPAKWASFAPEGHRRGFSAY